jgi:hypothetical protein
MRKLMKRHFMTTNVLRSGYNEGYVAAIFLLMDYYAEISFIAPNIGAPTGFGIVFTI